MEDGKMTKMESIFKVIFSTMRLQMKSSFARPMFRFCLLCNPLMNTVFLYFLYSERRVDVFLSYVILGAGLMGIWGCICFSSIGDINRERFSATLSLIYTSPVGFGVVILGKILGNTLLSLLTFVLSYFTTIAISGKVFVVAYPLHFLLAFIVMIFCFSIVSIGIAYAMMLSRKTELYMNLIELPVVFLCGFTFPVEVLPKWVQAISNFLVPTWAVRTLRSSAMGGGIETYWHGMGIEVVEIVACVIISLVLFAFVDKRVRISATLEVS